MQNILLISFLALLYGFQFSDALFFGCGCRQCGCTPYSYPAYQPSYQPNYVSSYPPGPIAGYILRPVGPAPNAGYAVPGGGSDGIPVIHSKHGHIGYLRSDGGNLPMNMPVYWQPDGAGPYEAVSLGRLLL